MDVKIGPEKMQNILPYQNKNNIVKKIFFFFPEGNKKFFTSIEDNYGILRKKKILYTDYTSVLLFISFTNVQCTVEVLTDSEDKYSTNTLYTELFIPIVWLIDSETNIQIQYSTKWTTAWLNDLEKKLIQYKQNASIQRGI